MGVMPNSKEKKKQKTEENVKFLLKYSAAMPPKHIQIYKEIYLLQSLVRTRHKKTYQNFMSSGIWKTSNSAWKAISDKYKWPLTLLQIIAIHIIQQFRCTCQLITAGHQVWYDRRHPTSCAINQTSKHISFKNLLLSHLSQSYQLPAANLSVRVILHPTLRRTGKGYYSHYFY